MANDVNLSETTSSSLNFGTPRSINGEDFDKLKEEISLEISKAQSRLQNDIFELQENTRIRLSTLAVNRLTTNQTIFLMGAGATNGAATSFFTDSASMQVLNFTRFALSKNDYAPTTHMFLEMVYRAGANGEANRTTTLDLYDLTGGSVVVNGTVSGTAQEGATPSNPGALPLATSSTSFFSNLAGGTREYILRYGRTTGPGTAFVDLYEGRLIIKP